MEQVCCSPSNMRSSLWLDIIYIPLLNTKISDVKQNLKGFLLDQCSDTSMIIAARNVTTTITAGMCTVRRYGTAYTSVLRAIAVACQTAHSAIHRSYVHLDLFFRATHHTHQGSQNLTLDNTWPSYGSYISYGTIAFATLSGHWSGDQIQLHWFHGLLFLLSRCASCIHLQSIIAFDHIGKRFIVLSFL